MKSVRSATSIFIFGVILLCMCTQAFGQGCAQCLDSTQATPPAVQAAYRHAIYVLGGAGVTLFVTGLILLRREQ